MIRILKQPKPNDILSHTAYLEMSLSGSAPCWFCLMTVMISFAALNIKHDYN